MSFHEHARAHGLILDRLIADGRWHRVPTEDKPRKHNGAYLWDGSRGVVRNFRTMEDFASWRDGSVGRVSVREVRQQQRAVAAETKRKQAEASKTAASMIARAAFEAHPYLASKGFGQECGLVLDGELLIPMRNHATNAIQSVQRIASDGAKKFLFGGAAKGAVYRFGVRREQWLCEGYATGLSLRAALRDMRSDVSVTVCFSAENMSHVAKFVKGPAWVLADNDESGTGERCARATGLPWAMPEVLGMDGNDLHQASGLRALVRLIRQPRD